MDEPCDNTYDLIDHKLIELINGHPSTVVPYLWNMEYTLAMNTPITNRLSNLLNSTDGMIRSRASEYLRIMNIQTDSKERVILLYN